MQTPSMAYERAGQASDDEMWWRPRMLEPR